DVTATDGPGPGAACSFNRDCVAAERCVCASGDCRCEPGVRGAGRVGVDACMDGNDCASALCVEGPGGGSLCSDACASAATCPTALPRCLDVPTVGRFCARDPASGGDAGADGGIPGCAGACAVTDLVATFGAHTGAFERAQHGTSGVDGIYVEAHAGGNPACPSTTSPTPDRTLVISGLRPGTIGVAQTEADGVTASLLDFVGTLISTPVARATAVRVTPRYVDRGAFVSFGVEATFASGTVRGGFFAPHCASLDAP
ncbi:MAG: hypothetical protein WCJ30_26800, partial [Deltaproteobacteria bacterium]